MKNLTLIAAALSAMLTLAGCDSKSKMVTPSPVEPSPAPPIPQRFATLEDLKPHQAPAAEANLLLGGVEVPVTLVSKAEPQKLVVISQVDDQGKVAELDREVYRWDNTSFFFVSSSSESYNPPIPVLQFPFTSGDTWDWTGKVTLGARTYDAKADVKTETTTLNLPTGNFQAIQSVVSLHTEFGSPEGTRREFKFWFRPGEGLVKRTFGQSSERSPRSPDAAPRPGG